MISGHLLIGAIVGPQGIKGQFKVKPFTATPQALSAYGPVTLDDGRQLQLQVTSVNAKGLAIVRAKGVETREAAEALRGVTLHVSRDRLPDLDDGEIYHADLLGMAVTDQNGQGLANWLPSMILGLVKLPNLRSNQGQRSWFLLVVTGCLRLIWWQKQSICWCRLVCSMMP